jgi:hypothetical protein
MTFIVNLFIHNRPIESIADGIGLFFFRKRRIKLWLHQEKNNRL